MFVSKGSVTMLNILVVRAGSTEFTGQGRVQGTLDVPLSEDGRREIELASEQLEDQQIEAIYCGPCRASKQSAEIIGRKLDLKPKTIDKLRNLDHGLWQGMLIDEVKTKQPKVYKQWQERPETVCPPDGETIQDAQDRLQAVLKKLTKKHKSGTVAVVLIDPLAKLWRHLVREDDLGDMWDVNGRREQIWQNIPIGANATGETAGKFKS